MTEKEKAKAYDEALKKASAAHKDDDRHLKATLERIFPELKESEDEKIKKAIIEFFESEDDNATYSLVRKKDIIAWLEKQGKEEYGGLKSFKDEDVCKFMQYIEKQAKAYELNLPNRSYDIYAFAKDLLVWLEKQNKNSIDKIEPKFKVGDWVVNKFGDSWHIDSLDKKNYQVSNGKGNYNYFPISKHDEMHLWAIQDAKNGDVIQLGKVTAIFKKYIGREKCICYCSFCKNAGFEIPIENGEDNVYGCHNATPATKEHRYYLMNVMNNAGYEWDIEKKELKKKCKN